MELEGISNACKTNVMMNRPVTSTPASEARNSTVVSLGFSFTTSSVSFFATFAIRFKDLLLIVSSSTHQPERASPSRSLVHMGDRIRKMKKSITHGWGSGKIVARIGRRPVDQERPADDIFA